MGILKNWLKSSSPTVKVLMAVSITTALFFAHKMYYAPYARRQRHLQAEEWANIIIEKEENLKSAGHQ